MMYSEEAVTALSIQLLAAMREAGVTEAQIDRMNEIMSVNLKRDKNEQKSRTSMEHRLASSFRFEKRNYG